jgi:pyridoxal phosphate enzyme (YggS family)
MAAISENMQAVRGRIARAARAAGRDPASITLLAVSKTHPPASIEAAWRAGQRAFGESYVQEAVGKIAALAHLGIEWHLVGPLQSNKTRLAAERFAWVHSVDRERIARRLAEQRPAGLAPLNVLIQVNVSGEASKSGVAPDQVLALARQVQSLKSLRLRGLMAIPEPGAERSRFRSVRALFEQLRAHYPVDTLSMGMSEDMEAAIAEGATLVRVGTAIFGERKRVRDAA